MHYIQKSPHLGLFLMASGVECCQNNSHFECIQAHLQDLYEDSSALVSQQGMIPTYLVYDESANLSSTVDHGS